MTMPMPRLVTRILDGLPALVLALGAHAVLAQSVAGQTPLASQSLRPYWHVFIAYAIVILVVLGWVISIGRRLKDIQERIGK